MFVMKLKKNTQKLFAVFIADCFWVTQVRSLEPAVAELHCQDLNNSLGIDIPDPALGWIVKISESSSLAVVSQTANLIFVASLACLPKPGIVAFFCCYFAIACRQLLLLCLQ